MKYNSQGYIAGCCGSLEVKRGEGTSLIVNSVLTTYFLFFTFLPKPQPLFKSILKGVE
jgi:hypothetical protein|tara:strand:- start:886 stop:1059 length:174 start_codon:yes stop_codon:yes gene_type:complete